jgi:integrase
VSALAIAPAPVVGFSHLRDQRHKQARSAGDQEAWLAWLELGGLSPRTLEDYEWATARLLRAFPGKAIAEFTDADLALVLRTFPPRSRRTKKAPYDSLFKWAAKTGRISRDANPMEQLPTIAREPQKVIDVFTDAEIARLTALAETQGDLFLILFDTGLRRGEAMALQVRDCIVDRSELVVRRGKGGKDRVIPMTQRLTQRLAGWFLLDALRPTDHLWPTRPGGYYLQRRRPMGDTSFMVWWRRALEAADVRYRNPHTTRHTFATRWLRKGGRLETLSRAMGHASIRTTADLYAHLDLRDLERDLQLIEAAETDLAGTA